MIQFLFQDSQDSNDSGDNTKTPHEKVIERYKQNNNSLIPSTTPLEPDKNSPWKSVDNITKLDNVEVDKEFDSFSKERIDKNNKNPVPLEPSILIVNAPKNNLGTVNEDEEKHIDSRISRSPNNTPVHTAYSINFEKTTNDVPFSNIKDTNRFNQAIIDKAETVIDPLLNIPVGAKNQNENTAINNTVVKEDTAKHVPEIVSPLKSNHTEFKTKDTKLNFEEISKNSNERSGDKKLGFTDNKPVLRDRSASIGTLNLKTPIAHLIGEQNRTMLFQVM